MAIAKQGRSITFTAVNEATKVFEAPLEVVGMTFQGTGLTAGQRLVVRDSATVGSGNILADYVVMAATDNADLWVGRDKQDVAAIGIDNNTLGGTWVLTVFVK